MFSENDLIFHMDEKCHFTAAEKNAIQNHKSEEAYELTKRISFAKKDQNSAYCSNSENVITNESNLSVAFGTWHRLDYMKVSWILQVVSFTEDDKMSSQFILQKERQTLDYFHWLEKIGKFFSKTGPPDCPLCFLRDFRLKHKSVFSDTFSTFVVPDRHLPITSISQIAVEISTKWNWMISLKCCFSNQPPVGTSIFRENTLNDGANWTLIWLEWISNTVLTIYETTSWGDVRLVTSSILKHF